MAEVGTIVAGAGAKKAFDLINDFLRGSKSEDAFPKCGECDGSLVPVKINEKEKGVEISWACIGCEIIMGPTGVKEGRKEDGLLDNIRKTLSQASLVVFNSIIFLLIFIGALYLISVIFDKILEIFGLNLIPSI